MASLYREPTLQNQIDITLTRLILEGVNVRILHQFYSYCSCKCMIIFTQQGSSSINIQQDVSSTLNTFCSYQQSINIADDSNPLHFDHAVLITR